MFLFIQRRPDWQLILILTIYIRRLVGSELYFTECHVGTNGIYTLTMEGHSHKAPFPKAQTIEIKHI